MTSVFFYIPFIMIFSKKAKGYLLGAVAAATYGLNPLFTLPLYSVGMTTDSVLFFRYLLAVPIMAVMIVMRGRSFNPGRGNIPVLFIFGLIVAFSSLGLFLSYDYMDAGIASTMLFVYPVMVAVLMAIIYRERISAVLVGCILGCLAGLGLLYQGDGGNTLSLTGTLLVMLSSLCYALYIVGVNRRSLRDVPTLLVTFYVLLFGLLVFVVSLMLRGGLTLPPADRWYMWGCIVGLAVFPTVVSFLCTTIAIQIIGSTPTAILGALEPVTAVVIGVLVFHEAMTLRILLGIILIIVSVSIVVAAPSIHIPLNRIRRLFPSLRRRK